MSGKTTLSGKQHSAWARLRGMWALSKGYRGLYLLATLALGAAAIAKTSSFLLLSRFIDNLVLEDQVLTGILAIALGFVGLALLEGLFTFLSGRMAARTAEGITRRLRNDMFDHLQRLTFAFHDKAQTGDLIQRVTSDISAIQRFFAEQAMELGRVFMLFAVNFVALLTINVQLAFFSVIVVPVIAVVSIFFFRKVSQRYEDYQDQDGKVSTVLQENLSGVRVVKAFARQSYEIDKFEVENYERFKLGRRLLQMHSLYWPITDILAGGQMVAGYLLGALMVINGVITLGDYLAYVGMLVWIIQPMRGLGRLIVQASTGLVSNDRVREISREEREPIMTGSYEPQAEMRGALAFRDVGFEYEPGVPVLQDISFSVKPGQAVALLGPTGSGKTTLVSLLPRFYEYTDGSIELDGVELADYSRDTLRQNIGIVEQEPFLFSRSIRENISYGVGRAVTEDEVIEAAKAASIHDVILGFPEGYNTVVGEKGVTLSGGQKQRVAIARTLLKNPRILLLDDATSSVDMETEADIRIALDRLMQKRTTFIIAHRVQSVMNADLILVLDKGRIVQHGTHETLVSAPGFYQKIYDLQARIESEIEREMAGE
ncbi:MAG TPA: ABC transporter ATP-binding protein [Candidatus Limnocylindrales bacterium]|nr:ABC transporter ATP-binding protein [Candidatus Limnocylindrales bacterium]